MNNLSTQIIVGGNAAATPPITPEKSTPMGQSERCVCSTTFERVDVIYYISGAASAGSPGSRTRLLSLEVVLSSRAAPVAAMVTRSHTVRAERRAMAMAVPGSGQRTERRGLAEQ